MLVIPAIDFSAGRLARVAAGQVVPVEAFDGDPVSAARTFAADGATWMHAVDLDLAFSGRTDGLATFSTLRSTGMRMQASGGIRSEAVAEEVLATGAERVVIGSAALFEPAVVERLLRAHGPRVAIGLEVQSGRLRPRGAASAKPLPDLEEVLTWLSGLDVRVVLTSVGLVGSLAGPDLEVLERVRASVDRVVLAGGVAGTGDLHRLAEMKPGPEAVILGRALYEGDLTLADALRAVGEAPPDL